MTPHLPRVNPDVHPSTTGASGRRYFPYDPNAGHDNTQTNYALSPGPGVMVTPPPHTIYNFRQYQQRKKKNINQ